MHDDICDFQTSPLDPEVQKLLGGDDLAFVIAVTGSGGPVLYVPSHIEGRGTYPLEGVTTIEHSKVASLSCYCKNGRKICCVGNICTDKGPC